MSECAVRRVHRPMWVRRRATGPVLTGVLAGALLAGCASGEPVQVVQSSAQASGGAATSGPATPTVPIGGTADSSPGAARVAGAEPAPTGTGPIEQSVIPSPSGLLNAAVVKEIRSARHEGFDRVVVEYQGTFGAWRVAYADRITEDPTGDPVPLQGSAFLSVIVQNATFDNLVQVGDGVPHLVYDGPRRISPGLPNVREIADAGDFEAVMALGIGVDHGAGVRAYRLEDPSRLVIDVAH